MSGTTDRKLPDKIVAAPLGFWLPLSTLVFAISAVLLFYDLGHYPLWCDEADNALFARSIARTGDLHALIDHNLIANRNGACLKDLRGRYQPPLPYYLTAPFVGTEGTSALWPRIPFAICGLLSVAFVLYWISRSQQPAISWIVFSLGLLGNVSFFLYCRQCRYYSLAILLSLVIAYLYLHWEAKRWKLAALVVASLLLLATHYLAYAGLYAALGCDYLLFQRRRQRFSLRQMLWALIPQVLFGAIVVSIYNPLGSEAVPNQPGRDLLLDKLTLLWWGLRDINACEFGVGLLMLAAPILYFLDKNNWLLRGPIAILVYVGLVVIATPQPVALTSHFDIRYLSALIPLCIFLTALVILTLARFRWYFAIPLAILSFDTNLLNLPLTTQDWGSTIYHWIEELHAARITPTQLAIDWIDENVRPGQSIWVMPLDLMAYPLMYHAPEVIYAWQLKDPPNPEQFEGLPKIHFAGQFAPDYILSFRIWPAVIRVINDYKQQFQIDYVPIQGFDIYWADLTRPELFWRTFQPVTGYNPETDGIYIWRRSDVATKQP